MQKLIVICYHCGKPSPDKFRHMACPHCGHRLPGIPSNVALGEHPQASLRSLIAWGWVFAGLALFSGIMGSLLHAEGHGALWAAQATFAYSALTGHVTGLVIGLILAAVDIGTSRWHGLAIFVFVLASAVLR